MLLLPSYGICNHGKNEMNELISIIIPIYNVEQYLPRCLDSVTGQTYRNLDIILIDDGSTDNSSAVMERYAVLDSRIRIFHKPNGGLSEARNFGLDKANGSYITFVDSDDWISPEYIEHLYNNMQEYKADISVVNSIKVWNTDISNISTENNTGITEYTHIGAISDMWYQKTISTNAWGKLYRADLFEDIYYPVGKIYEDLAVTHLLLWRADKIVYSPEPLYYYYQRNDSIMYRRFDARNMDRIHAGSELLGWAQENCPQLMPAAQTRFFVSNIQVLREIPLQESYADELRMIKKNLRKYRWTVLRNREAKTSIRMIAMLSWIDIRLLKKLGYLYKLIYK